MSHIETLRKGYHQQICRHLLFVDSQGIPSNADKSSSLSVRIARAWLEQLTYPTVQATISGQTSGKRFEELTAQFLQESFEQLQHLRPGNWHFEIHRRVEEFAQYEHLADLAHMLKSNKLLRSTLGDYIILPDIILSRRPIEDAQINQDQELVSPDSAPKYSPLRQTNSNSPLLHASISCKWTIRSDRSQNSRTEALNLIRNRKGHTPHIAIVSAEPLPSRLASIALGTGDIDCVYHVALPELQTAVANDASAQEMLEVLTSGNRLRDISDLPFDLAI